MDYFVERGIFWFGIDVLREFSGIILGENPIFGDACGVNLKFLEKKKIEKFK